MSSDMTKPWQVCNEMPVSSFPFGMARNVRLEMGCILAMRCPLTCDHMEKDGKSIINLGPNQQSWCSHVYMAMDQYLLIPFLVGWKSMNPSYFDVNYRGTRFWHTAIWFYMNIELFVCRFLLFLSRLYPYFSVSFFRFWNPLWLNPYRLIPIPYFPCSCSDRVTLKFYILKFYVVVLSPILFEHVWTLCRLAQIWVNPQELYNQVSWFHPSDPANFMFCDVAARQVCRATLRICSHLFFSLLQPRNFKNEFCNSCQFRDSCSEPQPMTVDDVPSTSTPTASTASSASTAAVTMWSRTATGPVQRTKP